MPNDLYRPLTAHERIHFKHLLNIAQKIRPVAMTQQPDRSLFICEIDPIEEAYGRSGFCPEQVCYLHFESLTNALAQCKEGIR